MLKTKLGRRMKENYENRSKTFLVRRVPVIIRLDGKAFHTFTSGFRKPFDAIFSRTMQETAKYLCENIQGCQFAYTQSDEISLLITDYSKLNTDAWFDYNMQKMCSISASMATLAFNNIFSELVNDQYNRVTSVPIEESEFNWKTEFDTLFEIYFKRINTALFDARAFNVPKEEVCNCFIWRQQDATKNAIAMVGQANFPHKRLHKLNGNEIQELLWQEKGINFNNLETYKKRGSCVVRQSVGVGETERSKWVIDLEVPIFSKNRGYIEQYI